MTTPIITASYQTRAKIKALMRWFYQTPDAFIQRESFLYDMTVSMRRIYYDEVTADELRLNDLFRTHDHTFGGFKVSGNTIEAIYFVGDKREEKYLVISRESKPNDT